MYDGLGSTRQLLNADQATTDTYSYEAFGNLMASSGSTANPYKYVGSLGYYQTGSSLMHLGARYYMPEVGRFTSKDPLEPALRNLEGGTRYAYAENKAVRLSDAAGLQPCDDGPEVTKKKCRGACKKWKYTDGECRNFCKSLKGVSCGALEGYCDHIAGHKGKFPPNWGNICHSVLHELCE